MIYVQGIGIYVLTFDGRFRRFDDTWVSGVDPDRWRNPAARLARTQTWLRQSLAQ